MVIIKTEAAHGLKPEFIKKVLQNGYIKTRSGYEYIYKDNLDIIIRREPLTGEVVKICSIEGIGYRA